MKVQKQKSPATPGEDPNELAGKQAIAHRVIGDMRARHTKLARWRKAALIAIPIWLLFSFVPLQKVERCILGDCRDETVGGFPRAIIEYAPHPGLADARILGHSVWASRLLTNVVFWTAIVRLGMYVVHRSDESLRPPRI